MVIEEITRLTRAVVRYCTSKTPEQEPMRTQWTPFNQRVLRYGELITDAYGKIYCALQTGMVYEDGKAPYIKEGKKIPGVGGVPKFTYVKVPA